MNKVAAFALRRKNSILSMSEKMFCPPQPLRFWITPACAGKRRSDWIIRSIYWDHPRLCGEKVALRNMMNVNQGSPPRMRGKACIMQIISALIGITPAYAGKSRKVFQIDCRTGDHPRACGEKTAFTSESELSAGSPPRMRGKAWGRCCPDRLRWDHPRVCGEKQSK